MTIVLHFPGDEFEGDFFERHVDMEEIPSADYYCRVDMALPNIGDILTKIAGGAFDMKVVEREYSLDQLRWKIKLQLVPETTDADPYEVIRYFDAQWSIEPL